jgi:hypothetical protein
MALRAYSPPDDKKPLAGHAVLTLGFNGAVAAFAAYYWRSGRSLPERIPPGGFVGVYLREPRLERTLASAFAIVAGSDLLQEAWVAVDKRA